VLTPWRPILKIGGLIVALSLLAAGGLTLHPLVWPAHPDTSLRMENGKLTGTAVGHVAGIDITSGTLDVSASLIGLRPTEFRVMPDTAITIQDKQGGLGDLWKDMPVRVSYEVRDSIRFARSIDLVSREATPPPPSAIVGAPTPASAAVPAHVTPPPAPESNGPAADVNSSGAGAGSAPVAIPTRRPEGKVSKPIIARPTVPAPTPRRAVDAAPVIESAPSRPLPGDSDGGDGSAVIDWLLSEGRKRERN
jgi:hypothetical protein